MTDSKAVEDMRRIERAMRDYVDTLTLAECASLVAGGLQGFLGQFRTACETGTGIPAQDVASTYYQIAAAVLIAARLVDHHGQDNGASDGFRRFLVAHFNDWQEAGHRLAQEGGR